MLYSLIDKDNHFLYQFTRDTSADDVMRDIHDGEVIQKMVYHGHLLSVPGNTGLILCTDGVPVYKSSQGSLRPIYLALTGLPPSIRMRMKNLIIAGLWHGPTKPHIDIILKPVLENIAMLSKTGVMVSASGTNRLIHPKLLIAVFDLPAKAAATNTKQFNGEYGCFYCTDKGVIYEGTRIYPPEDTHTLRTPQEMKQWAAIADRAGTPCFGVKGSSLLGKHIQYPSCVPVDYMHSILEGVFKQLMKRWFDSRYHNEPYSLRKYMADINRFISTIKPPSEVPRTPRPLDAMAYYKASEYRAWLLFYSLPIMCYYLPPDHGPY